jgi:hypothetical protein
VHVGPVSARCTPARSRHAPRKAPTNRALRLLIRRTPPPVHGGARGGTAGGRAQAGHPRGAAHRPTGR